MIIFGGDFKMILDTSLDCFGRNPKIKNCVKIDNDIMVESDLFDIWRIRNVRKKRFTWRNSSSELHRRLDFWLVSDNLQDDVKTAEISPTIIRQFLLL